MSNPDSYVSHPLNMSPTKQAHCFSKSVRFPTSQKMATQAVYQLPSTKSKRSTTFGYGQKQQFVDKKVLPPPGSYRIKSDFQRSDSIGVTIGEGRQKVTFGSFLLQALKKNRNVPSPDRYNPQIKDTVLGGNMRSRIKTDFNLKQKQSIPGPGSYKLTAVEISKNGRYALSNYKSATSPRYFNTSQMKKQQLKQSHGKSISTYQLQVIEKQVGKHPLSNYKNTVVRTFGKEQRPGLQDKSKLLFPSFKYRQFSQFGSFI